MSTYLWAKLVWGGVICIGAFVAGLMGWLPGQREEEEARRRSKRRD